MLTDVIKKVNDSTQALVRSVGENVVSKVQHSINGVMKQVSLNAKEMAVIGKSKMRQVESIYDDSDSEEEVK